jgi:hypothetical protein
MSVGGVVAQTVTELHLSSGVRTNSAMAGIYKHMYYGHRSDDIVVVRTMDKYVGSVATEKDAKSALASHFKIPVRDLPCCGQTYGGIPSKVRGVYVNGSGYEVRAPDGSYIRRCKTQADAHGVVSGSSKKKKMQHNRVDRRVATQMRFQVMKRIFKEVLCRSCAWSC